MRLEILFLKKTIQTQQISSLFKVSHMALLTHLEELDLSAIALH